MIKNISELQDELRGLAVLIVGGGPSSELLPGDKFNEYDIIIRLNNFYYPNQCKRVDYWFSYFGRNIKDIENRIEKENIKGIICKYPDTGEFAWTLDLRKDLWNKLNIPVYQPTLEQSFQTNKTFDFSPTSGLACIFTVLECNPSLLSIIGFDCFESGKSQNKEWDKSGNHKPQEEKKILEQLVKEDQIIWIR